MCELKKAGISGDCKLCKECFFETFTMCPDRDPNLSQKMYDALYNEDDMDWNAEMDIMRRVD